MNETILLGYLVATKTDKGHIVSFTETISPKEINPTLTQATALATASFTSGFTLGETYGYEEARQIFQPFQECKELAEQMVVTAEVDKDEVEITTLEKALGCRPYLLFTGENEDAKYLVKGIVDHLGLAENEATWKAGELFSRFRERAVYNRLCAEGAVSQKWEDYTPSVNIHNFPYLHEDVKQSVSSWLSGGICSPETFRAIMRSAFDEMHRE
jgi:hypothetical protein